MNRFKRTLGTVCDSCPLCNYARKKPETRFGRSRNSRPSVTKRHGKKKRPTNEQEAKALTRHRRAIPLRCHISME
jgi:hypothetical protein